MQKHLGGGNSITFGIFTPKIWGRWTHFDVHIFQMGWFNHQLDTVCCHSYRDLQRSVPGYVPCDMLWAGHWMQQQLPTWLVKVPAGIRWWSIPVVGWWLIKDSLKWLLEEHHIFFAALLLGIVVGDCCFPVPYLWFLSCYLLHLGRTWNTH